MQTARCMIWKPTSRQVLQDNLDHSPKGGVREGAARQILGVHRVVLVVRHNGLQHEGMTSNAFSW